MDLALGFAQVAHLQRLAGEGGREHQQVVAATDTRARREAVGLAVEQHLRCVGDDQRCCLRLLGDGAARNLGPGCAACQRCAQGQRDKGAARIGRKTAVHGIYPEAGGCEV